MLCACLYIVGSTIRLGVFARRDEIEIWKLVGATNGFVKAPFLVEGGCRARSARAARSALLYGLYRLASPRVEAVLGGWLASAPLGFFTAERARRSPSPPARWWACAARARARPLREV